MCQMKHASSNLGSDGIYVYCIEPYDGITNFATHDDTKISLLQCNGVFNSVRTSSGAFGVIYSITLMVQQFYWLEQKVTESMWEELLEIKNILANSLLVSKIQGKACFTGPLIPKGPTMMISGVVKVALTQFSGLSRKW